MKKESNRTVLRRDPFAARQQVDSLPDASQQALVLVIDGMVKQAQMEKVVGKRTAKRQQRG